MLDPTPDITPPLDRFRRDVLADDGLQDRLSAVEDNSQFLHLVSEIARARSIALPPDSVGAQIQPDPLGLCQWLPGSNARSWPSVRWLPVRALPVMGEVCVDWAHFAGRRLTEPFFEESARQALRRPFNRMFRYRMSLADFVDDRPDLVHPPDGLIFHMSRCGSTLLAQMLAAIPTNIVVSEAPPIDAILQFCALSSDNAFRIRAVRAAVAAYGGRRSPGERYFLKLDSWHTTALALFRMVFPDTPWIFLYRNPVEVMVSQVRQRGLQTVPGGIPDHVLGIKDAATMRGEEYCAQVLQRICSPIAECPEAGGGMLVNYSEFPDAVWTRILPHFGISMGSHERDQMMAIAAYNSKAPSMPFVPDQFEKRNGACDLIRSLTDKHLAEVYSRLEEIRAGQLRR